VVVPLILAGGMAAGALAERYGIPLPNLNMLKGQFVTNPQLIEQQAFILAQQHLIAEEGSRNTVYKDSQGFLTVGVGHKVVPADNLKLGDTISSTRLNQFFAQDIAKAFSAAKSQARELDKYNVEMIARLTSVNFQLGTGWRYKFPNTWAFIKAGNVQAAIRNLTQSSWYRQTPNRVVAFVNTLQRQYA